MPSHHPSPVTVLLYLTAINLLLYLDRGAMAGETDEIKQAFNLDYGLAGFGPGAFMVGYIISCPLASYLADNVSAAIILFLSCGAYVFSAFGTALSTNFYVFLAFRLFIGLSEGLFVVIAPVLIGDVAPRKNSGKYFGFFYLAIPVGYAVGFLLAGEMLDRYGWHSPFWVEGVIVLVISTLIPLMASAARQAPKEAANVLSFARKLRVITSSKALMLVNAGYAFFTFAGGATSVWVTHIIHTNLQIPTGRALYLSGAILGLTGVLGSVMGGWLMDKVGASHPRRKTEGAALFVCWTVTLLGAIPLTAAWWVTNVYWFCFLLFLGQFFLLMSSGPVNAAVLDLTPPAYAGDTSGVLRPFSMSFCTVVIHLFGDCASPAMIGFLADGVGLQIALTFLFPMLLLCALCWYGAWKMVWGEPRRRRGEQAPLLPADGAPQENITVDLLSPPLSVIPVIKKLIGDNP